MMTRIITFILALSIFTVSAHASTQDGLKEAFNELNFALTVDSDGTDKATHDAAMKKFNESLAALQAQGLTNEQMVDFVKKEVKDARIAKDIETAMNMIALNKMSPAEASNYMMETMRRSYSKGASWNGSGVAIGIIIAVFVVAAAVATGVIVWNGPKCGYSYTQCGATCSGLNCSDNYCCWN